MIEPGSPKQRALVLVVDRLGAGFLGPCGNTWIETPCFNQLASESLVLDQAWIDSPELQQLYQTLWRGGHAAFEQSPKTQSLPEQLRAAGKSSCLITDEPQVATHPLHAAFDQVEIVATSEGVKSHAEDTNVARLLSCVQESVASESCDLIWVHSQGMQGCWDAPLDFRDQFVEDGDPLPPRSDSRPIQRLDQDYDRDELQAWVWAYAGQVVLIDICLQLLLQAIDAVRDPPLFLLMGARGYPLGEHGIVGEAAPCLYSELLHVPLFMRSPRDPSNSVRCQQLIQPDMVYQTLIEWFRLAEGVTHSLFRLVESPKPPWPQHAISRADHRWAIRTPTWLAQLDESSGTADCRLFLKPDDYWDFNDVSNRCPTIVAEFRQLMNRVQSAARQRDWQALYPLNERLLTAME